MERLPKGRLLAARCQIAGFTLVELVVAVAIIALLMAIAIPSYTNYVVKSNRAEARVTISNVAQALERCYSRHASYSDTACVIAQELGAGGVSSETGLYLITAPTLERTRFVLEAVPQGTQATRDTKCGVFTLNQNGLRGMRDGGTVADCWN